MGIIALIVIGAAAGLFATRLMGIEADFITTISVGVLGAIVGGLLLRGLIAVAGWMAGFVGAVFGAMALIWLWNTYGPGSGR